LSSAACLLNLLERFRAVLHVQGGQDGDGVGPVKVDIGKMIVIPHELERAIESLTFVEEMDTLDGTVLSGWHISVAGPHDLGIAVPSEDIGVKLLGSDDIHHGYLKPADLSNAFGPLLNCKNFDHTKLA
jgi:hypothetical protein